MPRPLKMRSVRRPPLYAGFKPTGVQARHLQDQHLSLDEFEAIRLADFEGLDHHEAAGRMEISRSTFSRLVERARHKVARFLIEGRHLKIDGGAVHFRGNLLRCADCGHVVQTAFDVATGSCPECGSTRLDDLADRFGHGRCCRGHGRNRRR